MDNVARLALPRSAMPTHKCEICGEGFYDVGLMIRHVTRCVRKNDDAIEALAHEHRQREPLHDATDWEAVEFQRKKYGPFRR